MATTPTLEYAHGRQGSVVPGHDALGVQALSAGVSSSRAARVRCRDGRLPWTDRDLTHLRGWSVGPAHGATPYDRHWAPPPHRPLRSSDWPRCRTKATRRNGGGPGGAGGAGGAARRRPERSARPTNNAARTKRTGFARWPLVAAVRPSVAAGPAPHARPTRTVAGSSPVSSASAVRNHDRACVDV